jgi:hypothetical protein
VAKMKYSQLGNKFFFNVPVILKNNEEDINYMDCYVYGYIYKKYNSFSTISKNLEISKYKLKKIISNLIELNCVYEENDFLKPTISKNIFLKFEDNFLYDRTYLPNKKFLNIKQNAVFWKLYKYADPVEGMKNYYTIGTKKDIKKIDYEYLAQILRFSLYSIKDAIRHLKKIKLIKTQADRNSFYFGIQPIKENMKSCWHDEDKNVENIIVDQKTILDFYEK